MSIAGIVTRGIGGGGTIPDIVTAGLISAAVTAAVLSSPTGAKSGTNSATGTVSTDTGAGTLYYYASVNSSESSGTIIASGDSQTVLATGVQNVSVSGLSQGTTYYLHYVQINGDTSNVASSASFITDTSSIGDNMKQIIAPTVSANTQHFVSIPGNNQSTIAQLGLAGSEVITFDIDLNGTWYPLLPAIELTATVNTIVLTGPNSYRINKPTTAGLTSVYLDK